jgi:hypothetical protein
MGSCNCFGALHTGVFNERPTVVDHLDFDIWNRGVDGTLFVGLNTRMLPRFDICKQDVEQDFRTDLQYSSYRPFWHGLLSLSPTTPQQFKHSDRS